jgi:hypothetical protein
MTVVYAPWKGADEPFNRAVDLFFESCAPPGRIGWCRPLPGGFTTG